MQPSKSSSGGLFFEKHDTLVVQDLNETAKQIFLVLKGNLEGDLVKNELGKNQIGFNSGMEGKIFHSHHQNMRNLFTYMTGSVRVSGGPNNVSQDEVFILSAIRGNPSEATGHFSNLILGANYTGEINEILFYGACLRIPNAMMSSGTSPTSGVYNCMPTSLPPTMRLRYCKAPAEPENGLLAYYKFEPVSIEPDKVWIIAETTIVELCRIL